MVDGNILNGFFEGLFKAAIVIMLILFGLGVFTGYLIWG